MRVTVITKENHLIIALVFFVLTYILERYWHKITSNWKKYNPHKGLKCLIILICFIGVYFAFYPAYVPNGKFYMGIVISITIGTYIIQRHHMKLKWRTEYMNFIAHEQERKQKAIARAKNMIASDIKIDYVSSITGLTKEEVEALIQEKE